MNPVAWSRSSKPTASSSTPLLSSSLETRWSPVTESPKLLAATLRGLPLRRRRWTLLALARMHDVQYGFLGRCVQRCVMDVASAIRYSLLKLGASWKYSSSDDPPPASGSPACGTGSTSSIMTEDSDAGLLGTAVAGQESWALLEGLPILVLRSTLLETLRSSIK